VILFIKITALHYFSLGGSFATYLLGAAGLVALILVAPVAFLGAILPCCWYGATRGLDSSQSASVIGRITAVNAIAAALGASAADFLMLPYFGLWGSFQFLTVLFCCLPVVGLWCQRKRLESIGLLLLVVGLGRFQLQVAHAVSTLPEGSDAKIIAAWEGAYGRVEVVESRPGELILRQNLHYGLGSSGVSTPREYRQGHIPLLLHPSPRRVAFLGIGTGLTAAAALFHQEVEHIDIVELVPEVALAAEYFDVANRGVLHDPRVALQIDDARRHLRRQRLDYDVIVADLYVPWESRAGYLFSTDFYGLARERLAPGGIFCQWLPLYQLGADDCRRILNSVSAVFPHVQLCWGRISADTSILAVIASEMPFTLASNRIEERLIPLRASLEADDRYLGTPEYLCRLLAGTWPGKPNASINSDEHPWVEFHAPLDQRDGRLLTGERLLDFFDDELAHLEVGDVCGKNGSAAGRRAWQRRMILFDEGRSGTIRE
jgi:spermidine synthase